MYSHEPDMPWEQHSDPNSEREGKCLFILFKVRKGRGKYIFLKK
jgi:hypothetical protein